MKKLITLTAITLSSVLCIANPKPQPHRNPTPPPPQHHQQHHNKHHDNHSFWSGVALGTIATTIINTTPPPPPPPPTPIVRKVWINGRYVNVVQPNGTIIQVWQEGHWEIIR